MKTNSILLLSILSLSCAHAQTVNKCITTEGKIIYQSRQCRTDKSDIVKIQANNSKEGGLRDSERGMINNEQFNNLFNATQAVEQNIEAVKSEYKIRKKLQEFGDKQTEKGNKDK